MIYTSDVAEYRKQLQDSMKKFESRTRELIPPKFIGLKLPCVEVEPGQRPNFAKIRSAPSFSVQHDVKAKWEKGSQLVFLFLGGWHVGRVGAII